MSARFPNQVFLDVGIEAGGAECGPYRVMAFEPDRPARGIYIDGTESAVKKFFNEKDR